MHDELVFRTGLPVFHHLLTDFLQLLSDAFFKVSFMSVARIPPPPHRGKQMKQRHVATDANNQWKQGGCSKLEKGMLICSQMWALTWESMAGKLSGWESMKELMLNVDLGQIGMRKSLDKRRVEISLHKKQYAFKRRRFELWDKNWMT